MLAGLVAGLILVPAGRAAADAQIVRGPYLQLVRAHSVHVVWQTDEPTGGAVRFGRWHPSERIPAPRVARQHAVRLDDLKPDTRYVYEVEVAGRSTAPARFRTAIRGDGPFRFAAIGDFGTGTPIEYRNVAQIRREAPAFIVTTGDNAYEAGLDSEYDADVFQPFGPLMRHIAIWPSLGNHDYGDFGTMMRRTAFPYFRNWVLPQQPGAERYYSFRYGNAEFFSIDTEVKPFVPGSRQYSWLRSALADSDACWKIPFMHRPVHSEYVGPTAFDLKRLAQEKRYLAPLFERSGVVLVLDAHEHNYVRSKPINGVTYVLTGGGGATLDPLPPSPRPRTAVRGSFFHHVLFSVADRSLTGTVVQADGTVRDQFDLRCPAGG